VAEPLYDECPYFERFTDDDGAAIDAYLIVRAQALAARDEQREKETK
jgi:hypothetical protein